MLRIIESHISAQVARHRPLPCLACSPGRPCRWWSRGRRCTRWCRRPCRWGSRGRRRTRRGTTPGRRSEPPRWDYGWVQVVFQEKQKSPAPVSLPRRGVLSFSGTGNIGVIIVCVKKLKVQVTIILTADAATRRRQRATSPRLTTRPMSRRVR